MAEQPQPARTTGLLARRFSAWTPQRIAEYLGTRRDRYVKQLPRELSVARGLTDDQVELVIDEAIDYLVTEHDKPILDAASLEKTFWKAASLRARRMHEGRGATVRAGWKRVSLDSAEPVAADESPEAAAIRRVERHALLEFAAELTEFERRVLALRYGDSTHAVGRTVTARELGTSMHVVRRAERSIERYLNCLGRILCD
jgi:hypothetical protein